LSKSQNNKTRAKLFCSNDQALTSKINNKIDRKLDSGENKGNRGSKPSLRTINSSAEFKTSTNCSVILSGKINNKKSSNYNSENKIIDKVKSNVGRFANVRSVNCSVNIPSDDQLIKCKDYSSKKFDSEINSKLKNYHTDYNKDNSTNQQEYNSKSITNLTPRYSNQITSTFQRENNRVNTTHYSRDENNINNGSAYSVGRKVLDQQNSSSKATPINFPPLRAPQSIVNVRHPFVTESRTKHNDSGLSNGVKTKSSLNTVMQSNMKELEPGRQTYHNFNTNTLNMAAGMSPYLRPDSFPQPTLTSVLFSDTSQFTQSASTFSTNQLNQFQTYDPTNYHANTPVIPQYSDNSLSFPQYDSTTFVQSNHFPAADLANNQFQYQAPTVGQIQDSPLFIQSLQNPIAMADQYTTPNYARTVRTELIHRLRRPPRFSN
jgi:ribosomal protein S26